jgi:TniQ
MKQNQVRALSLSPPIIPPRSRLFCLEPIGVGTPDVESLTGYIARLAEAHSVSAGVLFGYELVPFVDNSYWREKLSSATTSSLLGYGFLGHTRAVNGTGKIANEWVPVLEKATMRPDLSWLTLSRWREILSTLSLLRQERAWCSACYQERRLDQQVIYEPLIWCVEAVKSCLKHRQHLQTQCRFCHRQSAPLSSRSRPGFCSRCRNWLGLQSKTKCTATTLTNDEFEKQTWVIRNVGDLLSTEPDAKESLTSDTITHSLNLCIETLFGGSPTLLSRRARVPKQTISNWRVGVIPSLDALLRVCFASRVSLISFIYGRIPQVIAAEKPQAASKAHIDLKTRAARTLDLQEIKEVIDKAFTEQLPPTLVELAQRVGLPLPTLRYRFRSQCRAISKRYRVRKQQFHLEVTKTARRALEAALIDESHPSPADVARNLGMDLNKLIRILPDLCRKLSNWHIEGRKQRWQVVGVELETILKEWPPIPMREITKRTGYCETSLNRHHRALCRELAARYLNYRTTIKSSIVNPDPDLTN